MIHGLILVYKPTNITSHQAVDKIRDLLKIKKVGHFGTLDPLAEGLLLIGLGHATKFFDFYIKKAKLYSGKIFFGYSTTTYDAEGEPTSPLHPIDLNSIDIDALLKSFTGILMQIPPIYSAKKFKGKPMYRYAREDKNLENVLKPVKVDVHWIKGKVVAPDTLWFQTETSSGTYVRSLAHDMGAKLGVGAYLKELKREGIGEFLIENAHSLDELASLAKAGTIETVITPIELLLPEFTKIIVTPGGRNEIINGKLVLPGDIVKIIPAQNNELFRLFDDEGKLLAIAKKDPRIMGFKPYIVFT